MDWTNIITTLLTVGGTVAVAYITYGLKKSTTEAHSKVISDNAVIMERLDSLEKITKEQEVSLQQLAKKLLDEESANLIQQSQLAALTESLQDNNLRTLRLDLLHAIETDPDNQLVILDLAQKYFVDMKGNCYMSRVFQEWADKHSVNITSIFNKG